MGFPDFPIPEQQKSYLSQAEILHFLNLYADHFDIRKLIKFSHHVTDISPLDNGKWKITAINKPTKEEVTSIFDAVMICNGHYNQPIYPKLPGQNKFKGRQLHSHHYRSPDPFKGNNVLVIGAGPSGLELTLKISDVAEKVVLSHHSKEPITTKYPSNVELKPDVRCIREKEVEFIDGTCCCFDAIFYCTGYEYSFPFLNKSCGITVDDNHIQPLYKHMIHMMKPTMCFIGIPFNVCAFQMFDLQARFYVKYLDGDLKLPSEEEMREDTEKDMQLRWEKGYNKRQAHMMGPGQRSYYNDLATMANLIPIDPVIVKLRDESVKRLHTDLMTFREDRYKIVDKETFVKVY
ncbi:flavin-containing monooxygenase FMO GS-OX-like 2 isoform X2 [Agrilus planipennis]|nr:flavin-containing monooxygenase FMO GS-OX-like 2 isoform X2 [Agrilus planipennis]